MKLNLLFTNLMFTWEIIHLGFVFFILFNSIVFKV